MAAQVQTCGLLFHSQKLRSRILIDLGELDAYSAGLLKIGLAEKVQLPLDVVAALLLDAVDHNARDAQQRLTLEAHAVEGSGAN